MEARKKMPQRGDGFLCVDKAVRYSRSSVCSNACSRFLFGMGMDAEKQPANLSLLSLLPVGLLQNLLALFSTAVVPPY